VLRKLFPLLVLLCTGIYSPFVEAQNCNPPAITANSQIYNIFSPEQEMVLGELNYQRMSGDSRFIQDEKLLAYVREIGARLVRHLPPTGLKFQFFIIDMPTANAFNTPGGYVFLSRKLISFTKTEDELAGVMAHELGHATVHHAASDISDHFKKILNVTQLGDRKDITEKYNLFLERVRTKNVSHSEGHESEQQLEADRIGVFAMVAAGYDPNAFIEFFSRLVEEKAKSGGNWFTNIFNSSTPTEKRLREMVKVTEQLPAACRDNRAANASEAYLKWQADVVSFRESQITEELPGLLWKKELSPRLTSDISHFAVSPDGTYFLAQDDFAITVIQREPLKIAFQIPTVDARPASFTADGKFVVFGTEALRFEKWNIADAKPVEIRELVVRRDCWEHEFSPDGKYLACVDYSLGLNVLETQTGKRVWQKKDAYSLNFFELLAWIGAEAEEGEHPGFNQFFRLEFSPDSRYLVATRSNRFRFRFSINGLTADKTEDTLVALDLPTLKPISTGGELKKVTRRPFIFVAPDKILGMMPTTIEDSGLFSFPEGKRLAKFPFAADELKLTGNPDYVIVKPLANAKLGIFDLTKNTIVNGMNKADVTMWNDLIFFELASGSVQVAKTKYDSEKKFFNVTSVGTVDIPVGSMRRLYAANVSDNMQWLAVSSKTRGAIWDLSSGERKIYVRGFRGAIVAPNGTAIGDFPKYAPVNHSLVYMNAATNEANPFREIPEKGARQHGRFVMLRQSLKQKEKDSKEKEGDKAPPPIPGEFSDEDSLNREVRFELRDVINDKLIWSKEFRKEAPKYYFDDFSGRMIFYWDLGSEAGKARLKEEPALAERSRQMGNKDDDYIVEVYDAFAGKSVGVLLLETGKGSFNIRSGFSEGNWLVLHDDNNRVLIYSINDGQLRHRFFGANAAMNPSRQQMIVENYPGELTLYDLATGNAQARLRFKTGAAFVRFSLDGKKLLVLTSGQIAYAFDIDRMGAVKGD
jgi:WD40 repeat protein